MAEMTAKEFLEITQSICAKNNTCDKCEIKALCFGSHPPSVITEKIIKSYISRLEIIKARGGAKG